MQLLLTTMLIDALHTALEDRKIAFNGVRMNVIARPLIRLVVYAIMARKVIA